MPGKFPDRPFVGQLGSENALLVERRTDRLVCRIARSSVWFNQVMLFLFGSFLAFVLGTGFQDRSFPFPLIFAVVAWILAACWLVFPRNLAGAPRIEVLSGSGEVLFFRTARGTVSRILRRDEIARFAEEIQLYPSRGHPTKNHVLSLFTVGGAKVPLCASPEEPLIRALESEISRVTGVAGS